MKNKKRMKETPVVETKNEGYERGSVGEFIALLSEFPKDAKFTLNGNVDIDDMGYCDENGEPKGITIYPKAAAEVIEEDINRCEDGGECVCSECSCELEKIPYEGNEDLYHNAYTEAAMDLHLQGIAYENYDYLKAIRNTSADNLANGPLLDPNEGELSFERNNLMPYQQELLAEMRAHNASIAESFGELHRREIAALLEYNTQCLAQFAHATNKDMCIIIDPSKFED